MKGHERRGALAAARLYLVAPGEFPLDVLTEVIAAGVDIVQLRMKDAEAAEVLEIGDAWMAVCEDAGVPFVINDRADIAAALACDGVHLGQGDLPPIVARELLGPDVLIGRSTHSEPDIAGAIADHEDGVADYIAVGPVRATPTKPGRPAVGVELVRHASMVAPMPWFAIGGIDHANVSEVRDAGAERIVVVRAITLADDPPRAVEALRLALG